MLAVDYNLYVHKYRSLLFDNQIIEIFYYKLENRTEPFARWLDTLEITDQATIMMRLHRVALGSLETLSL